MLAKAITAAEFLSCERFYRDWALGEHGIVEGSERGDRVVCGAVLAGANDAQLAALERHRAAKLAVGHGFAWYLLRCVCDDWTWVKIAQRGLVSDKTAKDRAIHAIVLVHEHYGAMDGVKKHA
jgi:hypothetical protein